LPGPAFKIAGFSKANYLPSFDWDGDHLFVFNDFVRSEGFGNLYFFDTKTGQGAQLSPVQGKCCYRDARFSPDGKYLLFFFQADGQNAIQMYYVEFEKFLKGEVGDPIPLPLGLFSDPHSSPQPSLRPIP
jgi:Tol biopolymer transport system component